MEEGATYMAALRMASLAMGCILKIFVTIEEELIYYLDMTQRRRLIKQVCENCAGIPVLIHQTFPTS